MENILDKKWIKLHAIALIMFLVYEIVWRLLKMVRWLVVISITKYVRNASQYLFLKVNY